MLSKHQARSSWSDASDDNRIGDFDFHPNVQNNLVCCYWQIVPASKAEERTRQHGARAAPRRRQRESTSSHDTPSFKSVCDGTYLSSPRSRSRACLFNTLKTSTKPKPHLITSFLSQLCQKEQLCSSHEQQGRRAEVHHTWLCLPGQAWLCVGHPLASQV